MKVTAILKGMIDQNGHQPIQIRISIGNQRFFKPTYIKVLPSQFKNGKIIDHPKAREWNDEIRIKIIQYQAEALQGFKKKTPKTDLYEYLDKTIHHLSRTSGTLRGYNSQINKLKEFSPQTNISDINHDWLNRYKSFLKKRGNDDNTVWSSFKFLRTFIRKAYKTRLISENPFDNYEFPKYENPEIGYLTQKELSKIDKFCLDKNCPKALFEIGTWFLIASNTGMRISDVKAFDAKKNIINNRLVFKTVKTGEVVGLPILPNVRKLLQRINYRPLSVHENTYNKSLKIIAAMAGIEKRLHSHVARHTTGMALADAGVTTDVISKILGHASTKSTSIYAKITNKRIDLEMKKVRR